MIFVHELGHFLIAKKKGIKVEEFGFGYPPRLLGKKIGETTYSFNLIPMGGFVRVWGMEEKVKTEPERAFYYQSKKSQGLVLIAGVVMNFILALLVFGAVYGIKGVPEKMNQVKIIEVMENSPAREAGIVKETTIVSVLSQEKEVKVKTNEDFIEIVSQLAGEEIILKTDQGKEFRVVPRENPPEGEGALGVIITDSELIRHSLEKRIPLGIWYGLKEGIFWGSSIVKGTVKMIADIFKGRVPADVAGPIGIYKASSDIFEESGLLSVIYFFAIVSVNLAVVNLLPVPGTDGWHMGILVFEKLRGKRISWETKRKINQAGMAVLLGLFFLILIADIKRFILN